jgi:1,2-phenylacetyl-CoA epoxidase PaaB subunit
MFQIVGSLLALATAAATLATAPVYGLVFALATLGWVVKASPVRASAAADDVSRGSVTFLSHYR